MPRKRLEGAVRSFLVRIDTRPIRSTDLDHNHAFRASVAVKDLPQSLVLGTWFKQTSTPDGKRFIIVPIDKTKYQRKPKGVHEVTQDGARARFLISPGIFEPYKHKGAASYTATAYEMVDGSAQFLAPVGRRESKNPARTVGDIVGAGKRKLKREKIAALDPDTDISDNLPALAQAYKPTLVPEVDPPNFRGLSKRLARVKKSKRTKIVLAPLDQLWDVSSPVVTRIEYPDGSAVQFHADGTTVRTYPLQD